MTDVSASLECLDKPTKWPTANARLLGVGAGLPVPPLDRLANFSADEFERFALEWADGFLRVKLPDVTNIQQRGGAGDKGRDIVVWFGATGTPDRHWHLYQCKRYATALGAGKAIAEIAKVLFYSFRGDYSLPSEYWFVTRKGVTGDLQDLVDDPAKLNPTWSKTGRATAQTRSQRNKSSNLTTCLPSTFPRSISGLCG